MAEQQDGTAQAFLRNKVDGKRLLILTEDELKSRGFGIQRLGRRKNIVRAINQLKTSMCRNIHNDELGASALISDDNAPVNRSAGTIRLNLNRTSIGGGLGSIDRSTILSNAQSYFQSKGRSSSR